MLDKNNEHLHVEIHNDTIAHAMKTAIDIVFLDVFCA